MKIKKFRIWNYKSIEDSGDCYPAEGITVFAGKNESGKSSILQALEDFNVDVKIRDKAKPIGKKNRGAPKISIWFEVYESDLESIIADCKFRVLGAIPGAIEVCVTKTDSDKFTVESEFIKKIIDPRSENLRSARSAYLGLVTKSIKDVANNLGLSIPIHNFEDIAKFNNDFSAWNLSVIPHLNSWNEKDRATVQQRSDELLGHLSELNRLAKEGSVSEKFCNEIKHYLPNFILFSSFDDIFPNTIPISELKTNKWVLDLEEVSNIDVDIISGADSRVKMGHKTALNIRLNADFKKYWEQDDSKLAVDWGEQYLEFWIEEDGEYYEPEIRSQGRQWHLAFYIRVSARAKENVRNIILIDEPGLYLHANAQRDILNSLGESSKEAPIMFTTHSPYLIEADKLERIRLVQKSNTAGTKIENKIHAVSDKETLTPILTAIGLELNRGLMDVGRRDNIVVEGVSDYYYLNAFKKLLSLADLNFVHGGSSGNMPKVGTILQGWGCNIVYLYDSDKGYRDALKHIKKDWLAITSEMLAMLPVDGAIEDIFTKQEFKDFVLEGVDVTHFTGKNSEFMKNKDKVLVAKKFLESVVGDHGIELSEVTKDLIRKLFADISSKIALQGNKMR